MKFVKWEYIEVHVLSKRVVTREVANIHTNTVYAIEIDVMNF